MATARELFHSGKLDEALTMTMETVKKNPSDIESRSLLAELLCFSGDLERADKHLEATSQFAPSSAYGVAMLRHLVRAETARREVFLAGRVPEFIELPTESQQLRLKALLAIREAKYEEAAELVENANGMEQETLLVVNGNQVADFRDLDDVLGSNLEICTATGNYYWIHISNVVSLEFAPPECLSDLMWRAAAIETTGELKGRVLLPALYFGSHQSQEPLARVGRATDWKSFADGKLITGVGQREFLMNDEQITIMELKTVCRPDEEVAS